MNAVTDHPELARAVQAGVPLVPEPFVAIAETTGLDPDTVRGTLQRWKDDGILREISAVLEGSAFGWESALVAGRVPADRIDAVAAIVGAHPNVTHNYERNHEFNLWFTLAVPPRMGLQNTLRILEREAGVERFWSLPRTRTFKIAVRMDPTTKRNRSHGHARKEPVARVETTERDELLFRLLQTPLPFVPRPFAALGAPHGVTEDELLAHAATHYKGAIRRYAATFHHRKLGVKGNVMSAWAVPEDRVEEIGMALADLPEVSHCYARTVYPVFPFTLYAMIHGPDPEACGEIAERLAEDLGVPVPAMLQSTREFKKCRLRYFLPELEAWWDAHQETGA